MAIAPDGDDGMSELLTEADIEELYEVGANFAADAVIIKAGKVCLIERGDGGGWALPGGFREPSEHSLVSATRETNEETGLTVSNGQLVFSGRVEDPRNSDTRWIESDAYLFTAAEGHIEAGDDAANVHWFDLDSLPELYGSHQAMIENAKRFLLLKAALEHAKPIATRGGHMAYDYNLYDIGGDYIFTKQFSPVNFSHPEKEKHSLFYLQKEALVLDHLKNQGFEDVPAAHELIANSTLLLEGLSEGSGWRWKCPRTPDFETQYIEDVLASLTKLEETAPLELNEPIQPALKSFYDEGWGASSPETLEAIATKMRKFTSRLTTSSEYIERIIARLPDIASSATRLAPASHSNHHDVRQNNIAWHPEYGVRLIDWSWYGPGVECGDATSFLIDCNKNGNDVKEYMDGHFNKEYARVMIGFWLHHSLWPTRTEDDTVRLHQVASAISALELLDS